MKKFIYSIFLIVTLVSISATGVVFGHHHTTEDRMSRRTAIVYTGGIIIAGAAVGTGIYLSKK